MTSILEVVVLDVSLLPGTDIYILNLGDFWSSSTIELYLHRRYYELVDPKSPDSGILKKGRELFLTGCHLRSNRGSVRLLPTEYLVILLDENEDEDAMLLGAQFCSDSFSSISPHTVSDGASYSFYARIDSIADLESQGPAGSLQSKQITLVDSDDSKIKFILWGEQVILAHLFSTGSMLALDMPFIASIGTCEEVCLEYGTATQLYLVPFIQQEEQISIAPTQNRYQGSKSFCVSTPSQNLKVSQVTLPRDSQGTIDFSNYPFRSFVTDLRDKMTSISLYGTVADIFQQKDASDTVFILKLKDTTGIIIAKLHFVKSWSLGRVGIGHTIFLSGLSCFMASRHNRLEVSWFEKDAGVSLVNLSFLPALLNSSCLHNLSCLSDLDSSKFITHVCSVRVDQVEHCHAESGFSHTFCGHIASVRADGLLECSFCNSTCVGELTRTFQLEVTLADDKTKIMSWCTGQTAADLLQISPDDFYNLSEDEQAMYMYTIENERFVAAIVSSRRLKMNANTDHMDENSDMVTWEIVRALKSE